MENRYDRRRCPRWYRSTAPRWAQPPLDRPAHPAVDTADLLATGDFRQRRSDRGPPTDDLWAHRARVVAQPRKHRPAVGPTPDDLACGHDPIHAVDGRRLERGHQWRLLHRRLTPTVAFAAVGDLPAGDHRR